MDALLITHAQQYVGPGTVPVLLRANHRVVCHDTGFADAEVARNFEAVHPGAAALRGQAPEAIAMELKERGLAISAFVSNDVFPNTPLPIEEVSLDTLRQSVEYSEAYYPRARFIDDPVGRQEIAGKVPMGRLGEPREIGELIAFLASGRTPFTTGQVIHFTGGWP